MIDTDIYEKIEDAIFRSINANEAYRKIERILKENIQCIKSVNIIMTINNNMRSNALKIGQNNKWPENRIENEKATDAQTEKFTFPVSDDKRKYAILEIVVSNKGEAEKELNEDFMKNLLDLLLYTYKRFHI